MKKPRLKDKLGRRLPRPRRVVSADVGRVIYCQHCGKGVCHLVKFYPLTMGFGL